MILIFFFKFKKSIYNLYNNHDNIYIIYSLSLIKKLFDINQIS